MVLYYDLVSKTESSTTGDLMSVMPERKESFIQRKGSQYSGIVSVFYLMSEKRAMYLVPFIMGLGCIH